MAFIDIHTHKATANTTTTILSCRHYRSEGKISLGIHPYDISNNPYEEFRAIEDTAASNNVVAIGECGIDKLKSPASIETQKELFRRHALLAEKTNKPLIIHCVKAIDEILAIHKTLSPKQAWIIHGFRGKPQQAEQLTKAGLYISLGERFNPHTAKAIPADRLFIESDDSPLPIEKIYKLIAEARNSSIKELEAQIMTNAQIFKQF